MKIILTSIILMINIIACYCPNLYKSTMQSINPQKELDRFLEDLGSYETGDTSIYPTKKYKSAYHVINYIGAKGRWQLTDMGLADIKYKGTTYQFLNDKHIQKQCVIKLFRKNKKYLNYYFPDYKYMIGKSINGVKITFSGIIAACHLAGVGKVKLYFKNNYNAHNRDINGNKVGINRSVKDYIIIFSSYNIESII